MIEFGLGFGSIENRGVCEGLDRVRVRVWVRVRVRFRVRVRVRVRVAEVI